MQKRIIAFVLIAVVCLLVPSLLAGPVSATPTRKHFIKAIYFVRHTFLDPNVVMEWYYSPETHTFRWNRGSFVRYDSYQYFFGFGGKWIELKFYYK